MSLSPLPERRRWLRNAVALAALPGGMTTVISRALAAPNSPIRPGVHRLIGEVRVNGVLAREGILIRPGDTITTGADAQAVYVIGDDAFLQRGASEVSFARDAATQIFRVATGKILSVFGKRDQPRRIVTTTATIGIRGTGCYIEDDAYPTPPNSSRGEAAVASHPARRTYFCLCYGEVELTPRAAPHEGESYACRHHDHPLYVTDDPGMPKKMVPAELKNHTDLELTMLEALVGRRPPF